MSTLSLFRSKSRNSDKTADLFSLIVSPFKASKKNRDLGFCGETKKGDVKKLI